MNGAQTEKLMNVLLAAYPDADGLKLLLKLKFDVVLGHIVDLKQPHRMIVFELIQAIDAEGWLQDLVKGATEDRPKNRPLATAYAEIFQDQAPLEVPAQVDFKPQGLSLERVIDVEAMFQDPIEYIHRLAEQVGRVCRIELGPNRPLGTGFLVSRDLVITNHHVLKAEIEGQKPADKVSCRFDFQIVDGKPTGNSQVVRLAGDWLVDHSPSSPHDLEVTPTADPCEDELDYAIVRLDHAVGEGARGWIKLKPEPFEFKSRMGISILQHPDGDPIKLTGKYPAAVGLNRSGNRVRYDVSTRSGSSGSPVFDQEMNLVALHHAGDPNYAPDHIPLFNQGIPVSKISALLAERDKLRLLDQP